MSSTWLDDDEWTGGPKRPADRTPTQTPRLPAAPPTPGDDADGGWAATDGGAWRPSEDAWAPTAPQGPQAWQPTPPVPLASPAPAPAAEWGPTSAPWTGSSPMPPAPGGNQVPAPPAAWEPTAGAAQTVPDDPAPIRDRRGGGAKGVLAAALVSALVAVGVTVPLTLSLTDGGEEEQAQVTTQTVALPADDAPADTTPVQPSAPTADITSATVADVAEAVLPSVAVVTTFVGGQAQGSGSAVVFREDGYLVTNNHVIDGAGSIEVLLTDGRTYTADVVGTASPFDLAVLRVEADDLQVPAYADEEPRVGETAIAIGAPFGLNSTVTSGIVSALGRTLNDGQGTSLVDLVQTDAAINPGNSGGALVNASGQVIGINTAIIGASGANDGVGFAVPATATVRIAEQLIEQGFFEYAQLGVATQQQGRITVDIAEERGLDTTNGAFVGEVVPGSGAAEAGITTGDIIIAIDGEPVMEFSDLSAAIRGLDPGSQIQLEVVSTDGTRRTVDVTLGGIRTND